MIYLSEFILVGPVTVGMAFWHSRLIKANRPIQHGWWAVVYMIPLIAALIWQWDDLACVGHRVAFLFTCLIGRLIVFNISLNLFRGLPLDYTSATSTSVLDKIERRLFGARVWLAEVVLGVFFIFLQFLLR